MSFPKPERVEVGQWWYSDVWAGGPRRILARFDETWWETATPPDSEPVCAAALLHSNRIVYLGNNDHPAPSEWMIETLLAHAKEVAPKAADDHDSATIRHILNGGSTMSMDTREGASMNRSVLSLYKILRSLGKW